MSWTIYVADFPADAKAVDDLPRGFVPPIVLPRAALVDQIRAAVPGAEFDTPMHGIVLGADFSVEIDLGDEDPVHGFRLVLHRGDESRGVAAAIIDHLALRGLDEASEFFDTASAKRAAQRVADDRLMSVHPGGSRGDAETGTPTSGRGKAEMERILGGKIEVRTSIPGMRHGEEETIIYVTLEPGEDPRRVYRSVAFHVKPNLATSGAVGTEQWSITLADGTKLFGLVFSGDLDGWRRQIERGAEELGRISGKFVSGRLVLSDGRTFPFSELTTEVG